MANNDKPSCFGTLWDPRSSECRGGADPGYVNPKNGNNLRDQCTFFGSCGTKTQATRLEDARRQQQVIPVQNLVRPEAVRFQTPQQPPVPFTQVTQPQPQQPQSQQIRTYAPQYPQPQQVQIQQVPTGHMMVPVPQEQFHPGHYQPMPVSYAMPGYLTVQEPRMEAEGILSFAARSIARSMLKGGAHGLAHLIDVTPLRRVPPKG